MLVLHCDVAAMSWEKDFGILIVALRTERKLSQEKLAENSDLSINHVSFLERGLRKPSLVVFFKLAKGLELSPEAFISMIVEKEGNDIQ